MSAEHTHSKQGIYFALLAAVLFGSSTPFSKMLLSNVAPQMLAGLLYLGAGVGLSLQMFFSRLRHHEHHHETPLHKRDLPWLAGAVLFGGVLGPVLLLFGLSLTAAANASLLLNLEGVFTAVIAWLVFRENFDRRILWGMVAITAGSVVLTWSGSFDWTRLSGSLLITAACASWAIDNNLTRNISGGDPKQITAIKGLVAGSTNLLIALWLGASLPAVNVLLLSGLVGWLGYGISLLLFVLALRHIGTARTGAYFSAAPFVGVILSLAMHTEEFTLRLIPATILMALGVWLHVTERHHHEHHHDPIDHDHLHLHDSHHEHDHDHDLAVAPNQPHRHPHQHHPMVHTHPHYPDLHHRHGHA